MTELKYVQELLSTGIGTEGSLLIAKKIHDVLIPEVTKTLIPRALAALYFGPGQIPGSSYDINLEAENTMKVRPVGDGAEVWLDEPGYTSLNVKPLKYGVGIKITKEMEEDGKFPLLSRAATIAGARLGENENRLTIVQLDTAANTVTGGAAITIANITTAMNYLDEVDKPGTDMIIGTEVLMDLRNIDTFVEGDKFGSREMLQTGFIGNIYGLDLHRVSTNAGMTKTTSYILNRNHAYAIAEKRPVTVEGFNIPTHDMRGTVITQRIAVKALKTDAICKITTT